MYANKMSQYLSSQHLQDCFREKSRDSKENPRLTDAKRKNPYKTALDSMKRLFVLWTLQYFLMWQKFWFGFLKGVKKKRKKKGFNKKLLCKTFLLNFKIIFLGGILFQNFFAQNKYQNLIFKKYAKDFFFVFCRKIWIGQN